MYFVYRSCTFSIAEKASCSFFILAKFQKHGIGTQIAKEVFNKFEGKWSVAVMVENIKAIQFWRKVINNVTDSQFIEVCKTAEELTSKEDSEMHSIMLFIFITAASHK